MKLDLNSIPPPKWNDPIYLVHKQTKQARKCKITGMHETSKYGEPVLVDVETWERVDPEEYRRFWSTADAQKAWGITRQAVYRACARIPDSFVALFEGKAVRLLPSNSKPPAPVQTTLKRREKARWRYPIEQKADGKWYIGNALDRPYSSYESALVTRSRLLVAADRPEKKPIGRPKSSR